MRTIELVYDGSLYTFKWLKTILWARSELKEAGYKVSFPTISSMLPYQKTNEYLYRLFKGKKYDIVFLAFHHGLHELTTCTQEKRASLLKYIRNSCDRLVWLDTADSTGTCLFDVMPYVDRYLKKQILIDIERYYRPIWGGRIYCEYYHEKLGLQDQRLEKEVYPVLQPEYRSKLGLSWNMGLSDFRRGRYSLLHPFSLHSLPDNPIAFDEKRLDTYFNGTVNESLIGWQRKRCQELLLAHKDIKCGEVSIRVSRELYQHEIRDTKSIFSPFGWGEVCLRDFESFPFQSVLLKPSVENMITFPNYYRPWETYVPIGWEFENFYDAIDSVNTPEYRQIAKKGYDTYVNHIASGRAKKEFVAHLVTQI